MKDPASLLSATAPAELMLQASTFDAPLTMMSVNVFVDGSSSKLCVSPDESTHWPTISPLSLIPSRVVP